MALAGVGIVYLPNFLVDDAIMEKRLVGVLEDYCDVQFPLSIVYPQNRKMNRALRLFIDELVASFET